MPISHFMSSIPDCVLGAFRALAREKAPGEPGKKNSENDARLPNDSDPRSPTRCVCAPNFFSVLVGSLLAGYSCMSRSGAQIVAPLVLFSKVK